MRLRLVAVRLRLVAVRLRQVRDLEDQGRVQPLRAKTEALPSGSASRLRTVAGTSTKQPDGCDVCVTSVTNKSLLPQESLEFHKEACAPPVGHPSRPVHCGRPDTANRFSVTSHGFQTVRARDTGLHVGQTVRAWDTGLHVGQTVRAWDTGLHMRYQEADRHNAGPWPRRREGWHTPFRLGHPDRWPSRA